MGWMGGWDGWMMEEGFRGGMVGWLVGWLVGKGKGKGIEGFRREIKGWLMRFLLSLISGVLEIYIAGILGVVGELKHRKGRATLYGLREASSARLVLSYGTGRGLFECYIDFVRCCCMNTIKESYI